MDVPVEQLYQLAIREGNSKKPVYEMHKWWARRLGSVFRMLLLLATAPETQEDAELWRRFYEGDDLSHLRLLDPFMGGGTSIIEATKLRFQTAGVDIDPVAWFVTRQEVGACDLAALKAVVQQLAIHEVGGRIRALYRTPLPGSPQTGDTPQEADVVYNFWVDVLTCPRCAVPFEAHNHYKLRAPVKKTQQDVFCKACHQPATVPITASILHCSHCATATAIEQGPITRGRYTCPGCGHQGRVVDLPAPGMPLPKHWFAIEYVEPGTRRRLLKTPDAQDQARYDQAVQTLQSLHARLPLPSRPIPLAGREDLRPTTHGYATYQQLFNARQLLALGWLLEWIGTVTDPALQDYLVLAFSDALAANNLLCPFAYGYDKLTPLFGLHAYNMITRPVENNVWGTVFGRGSFLRCLNKVIAGKQYCGRPYESRYRAADGKLEKVYIPAPIAAQVVTTEAAWYAPSSGAEPTPRCLLLNQDAQALAAIRDRSIQIILSDPPYYNNLSYSELSDFYYAWIQPFLARAGAAWAATTTPYAEALFVKQREDVTPSIHAFRTGIQAVFGECHRVLADEGLLIFTFHHLDAAAWVPLVQALCSAPFVVQKVFPVRSEGQSQFHSSIGTVKWDVVLVCRKGPPGPDDIAPTELPLAAEILQRLVDEATTTIQHWQARLQAAGIEFAWPDRLSLAHACAVQWMTHQPTAVWMNLDVPHLFMDFADQIVRQLPAEAQKCVRKRKMRHRITPADPEA